jgi:enoyl-CoA hydratase
MTTTGLPSTGTEASGRARGGPYQLAAPGVARFELDRPDRGNALSAELVESLLDAVTQAAADESLHTLVLHAQGRHFCTGFDLSELDTETDASLLARFVRVEMLLDAIWRAPLRTVAIAQGRILGAGADLFAACDLRLLARGASLRFPGAGFGIVLGTRRLAQRVGESTALHWVSEAITIDDEQALAAGLAGAVLEPEALLAPAPGEPPVWQPDAPGVDRATFKALRGALDDGGADADLAALVRSASRPGLKHRILAYRERQMARRS